MRQFRLVLALAAMAVLVGAVSSFAQPRQGMMWRGSGGWGPGSQYNRMYDPKAVETISGEVTSIDRITPMKGMTGGVHVRSPQSDYSRVAAKDISTGSTADLLPLRRH